ncbi:thioredoxin domain-containing protein 6 [Dendropsophus ebraccatus]|uniref:thioredoxin domain-containing protein 6 n=1 Tax=Dendropsophus ebraccatus TaxID=150705 RepID=UPI003831B64F
MRAKRDRHRQALPLLLHHWLRCPVHPQNRLVDTPPCSYRHGDPETALFLLGDANLVEVTALVADMAGKKKEIILQVAINNQEQWEEVLSSKGLIVVDIYQAWCGPCKTTVSLFRKIKNELGDDLLQFAVAEADSIDALEKYRGKCEPTFLFFAGGDLVAVVRGANAPLLQKTILEQLEAEKKVINHGLDRNVIKDEALLEEEEETSPPPTQTEDDELVPSGKSYTVAIIKPDAVAHGKADEIIMKIQEAGFEILANEERTMTESEARDFYKHRAKEEKFQELVQFMSSGPCHVLIISKSGDEDVIPSWREFIGPTDVEVAKKEKPESLRAQYGTEVLYNAVHGSNDREQASRELAFFFPSFKPQQQLAEELASRIPERTLALIRPDVLKGRKDEVLQSIRDAGFSIAMQKEVMLTEEQVHEFYKEHVEQDYFPALKQQMTSGPVLALALVKDDAVSHWRDLLGPADLTEAVNTAPDSLRARFAAKETSINQLHGSSNPTEAENEINFFFPVEHTLAAIKPDALEEHRDEIMERIQTAGFSISQIKETNLSQEMAEEFYKEHKGKPFFDQLINYMCRGPCLMMILSKENAVQEWRSLMGPTDPAAAQASAPDSLRSMFAKSVLQNAVHGSSNLNHAMEKIKFIFGDIELEKANNETLFLNDAPDDVMESENSENAASESNDAAEDVKESENSENAAAEGNDAAEDVKESENSENAAAEGNDAAEDVKESENSENAASEGNDAAEDVKESENSENAALEGNDAAEDVKESENSENAVVESNDTADDVKESENTENSASEGNDAADDVKQSDNSENAVLEDNDAADGVKQSENNENSALEESEAEPSQEHS